MDTTKEYDDLARDLQAAEDEATKAQKEQAVKKQNALKKAKVAQKEAKKASKSLANKAKLPPTKEQKEIAALEKSNHKLAIDLLVGKKKLTQEQIKQANYGLRLLDKPLSQLTKLELERRKDLEETLSESESKRKDALVKENNKLSLQYLADKSKLTKAQLKQARAAVGKLTTDEIKEAKQKATLRKKFGVLDDEEAELRQQLLEAKRGFASRLLHSKASAIKERFVGDESLLAKATLRAFRSERRDKKAGISKLESQLKAIQENKAVQQKIDHIDASIKVLTDQATAKDSVDSSMEEQLGAEHERVRLNSIDQSLKTIATNSKKLGEDNKGEDSLLSAANVLKGFTPALIAGALSPLLAPALLAGLAGLGGLAVAKLGFTEKGLSETPETTGDYKLDKPVSQMGVYEKFSNKVGARRQAIEEMVENGKKFTAEEAADIKKYYEIDVPVDEEKAGQRLTTAGYQSKSAPAPTPPPGFGKGEAGSAMVSAAGTAVSKATSFVSEKATSAAETVKGAVGKWMSPINGGRISSFFSPSRVNPVTGEKRAHKGVDFAVPQGTPVMAANSGVVDKAEAHKDFGNLVTVKHDDGTTTLYGHNSKILVAKGQRVEAGQQIALSGNTGISSGPHLHFETSKGAAFGSQVDPGTLIAGLGNPNADGSSANPTPSEAPSATSPMQVADSASAAPTTGASSAPMAQASQTASYAVKAATGGTNVATIPTYAYIDAKFFALNLGAVG